MNHLLFYLYNVLLLLCLPLIAFGIVLRWRQRVFSRGFFRWDERWGRFSPEQKQTLSQGTWWWVHAVSLGEVKAIEPFLRRLPGRASVRVLLSVVTPEALLWAEQNRLADIVTAAPFDLPWVVRKVFRRVRPKLFISVESEFWPNLLREARLSGARVALINGRISQRSFHSYKRLGYLMRQLWFCLDVWAVRQEEDAQRFRDLHVPPEKIHVTGNMKYDMALPNVSLVSRPSSPVLVLGSTREGEEEILLPELQKLRGRHPSLCVIWAPRHVQRVSEIEKLLAREGIAAVLKSAVNPMSRSLEQDVIWDSMGDLLEAYALADVVIVGGSFVSKGGQNPLEPAALQRAIVFGPSMENFKGVSEELVTVGGAKQVVLDNVADCIDELLKNAEKRQDSGRRARHFLESRQGATDRTLDLLLGV